MREKCAHFDTVKFVNHKCDDTDSNKKKALSWILLALNEPGELQAVFNELIKSEEVLALYHPSSYFHKNKHDLLFAT